MHAESATQHGQGTFNLSFRWNGNLTEYNGKLTFGSVELRGLETETLISIPDSSSKMQKLPFRVKALNSMITSRCDSIKITLDQLKRVKLIAGILEISPQRGPKVMDSRTGVISSQERLIRSNRELKLEIPPQLEEGLSYTIVCTNQEAKLVKSDSLLTFETMLQKMKILFSSPSDNSDKIAQYLGELLLNSFAELAAIEQEANNYNPQSIEIFDQCFWYSVSLAKKLVESKDELETNLLMDIDEKVKKGNLNSALDISRKIENPSKRAQALDLTIRGFINHPDGYDSKKAWELINEVPDPDLKKILSDDLSKIENLQNN